MASISTTDAEIPRWLRRVERRERRLTPDIDKAYRRSDLSLWGQAVFLLLAGISALVYAWVHARHANVWWLTSTQIVLPYIFSLVRHFLGSDERWVAAVTLRVRTAGGVGPGWAGRQEPIRRWHRIQLWSVPVLLALYIAIWPVTHFLDRHPNSTRWEIESCEQAALWLCWALLLAMVLRRVNRKCFRATREALLAAEACGLQEPAAGATTGSTGWGSEG